MPTPSKRARALGDCATALATAALRALFRSAPCSVAAARIQCKAQYIYYIQHRGANVAPRGAAILHDVVDDTEATLADVERAFGAEVASLVDGVTKLSHTNQVRRACQPLRSALFSPCQRGLPPASLLQHPAGQPGL